MARLMCLFLCFFLVFFAAPTTGQVTLTSSHILSTTKSQPKFQLQNRKLAFLKSNSFDLPLINRWELRTQTHDFDLSEQRFTFRVRPNSKKERLSQRQLHLSTIQHYQEETREVLLEGLQKRYHACLSVWFSKNRMYLLKELEATYLKLAELYGQVVDIDNLIESEELQQYYNFQIFEYQQEVNKAIRKIQYFTQNKSAFVLSDTDFVTLSQLKERIFQINPIEPLKNPTLSLLENEINLIEKEQYLVEAKQKKWFSFAQMRYGGSDYPIQFRETFNLSFAFQLPTKGNTKLKLNQLELDQITAENEWGEAYYHLSKEQKNLFRSMSGWLEKYEQLSSNLVASQEKVIRSVNVQNTTEYSIANLKIKAYLLKKELTIQEVKEKIYRAYVDWLAITGKMIELPLVNYLSKDLERF